MARKRKTDTTTKPRLFRLVTGDFYWVLLLVAVLLTAAILVIPAPTNKNDINSENNAVFTQDWQYSIDSGVYRTVALPYIEKTPIHDNITLKNRLPDQLAKGATVLIRTSQQDVEVFVANTQIYPSNPDAGEPLLPSSAYHFVRLPTDGAGKSITVILTSPYERYAGMLNQIYMGSKASNIFFLIHENGLRLVIGFLIFIIGSLVATVFLFVKKQKNKTPTIYLGSFFTCAGFWLMVESKMTQFLIPYPIALTNMSIFALSLLPVFLGLYYYSSHEHAFRRTGKYLVWCMAATSFIIAALACINPMLPLYALPVSLIFMTIYIVIVLLSLLIESIRAGKYFSMSICGGFALGFFCLLELISYLLNMKDYNNSIFFTVGVLLFCILMVADSIHSFAKVYQTAIKVNALTILAYTDSLTGLKNRTAFLEQMSAETDVTEGKITLAMFDINNLKMVNDTQGHLVGDAMLRHSAKAVQASLRQEDKLYRIGGDEFAAILHHDKGFCTDILTTRIEDTLEYENQKMLSYTLSIAYGYATFTGDTDKTLFDTLARADEKMYARKKVQKSMLPFSTVELP